MWAHEAQTHLAHLLDEVEEGAFISITRQGVPIAMLIPYQKTHMDAKSAVAELRKWRKGISWGKSMNTRKAKAEGRQ